jgi:hypothetical protein
MWSKVSSKEGTAVFKVSGKKGEPSARGASNIKVESFYSIIRNIDANRKVYAVVTPVEQNRTR